MELEQYFNFLDRDDIRIHGTRVGIETVLGDYLDGASPEEIAARYRTRRINASFSIRFLRLRGYSNYANSDGASRNGSAHETISIFGSKGVH